MPRVLFLAALVLILAGCRCESPRLVCSTDVQCAAGQTTCADGVLRACLVDENGCSSWASPTTCPSGACADTQSCDPCTHTCAAGEVACTGGVRSACTADARGCRALVQTPCSSGFCDGTACGTCANACPSAGATSCAAGQLQTCVADANGCLAWSAPTPCDAGFCGGATSCGACTDGCAAGATDCAGGQLRTCLADANGCRAWSAPSSCTSGFCGSATACGTCANGCTTTGATECASGQLRTCLADANGCRDWSAPSACPSGFCGNASACGSCAHACQSVGATDCSQGALRTCVADANGCRAWSAPSSCASGFCASASACGTCANTCSGAGKTSCASGQLRTCTADANGCLAWSAPTACAAGFCGSAQACGSCSNTCGAAGDTQCASGALSTCTADANGCLAWSTPSSCAVTSRCRNATSCDRAPLAALVCSTPVVQGTAATLDATGSSDPDGDPLSFRYTLPDGGFLDGGSTVQVTMSTAGANAFSVLVSDPAGATATATCSVQVSCAPESDATFCATRGKNCGSVNGTDVCGAARTASCGTCTLPQSCGAITANVCGTPDPASIPAPRAVSPMSLSTVVRARPTFRWVLPAGADGARVEICPDRACAAPTLTFDATGTSAVPPADLSGRVVFFRLRGLLGSTAGLATSPVWQFARRPGSGIDSAWGQRPDFDNDGFSDAVISAPGEPKTWFFRGGSGGLLNTSSIATGVSELDSAGDVNGDGFGDLVLGQDVYPGSDAGVDTSQKVSLWPGFVSVYRVAGVGDVNGDGYSDVAMTYGAGKLDLYLGGAAGLGTSAAQTLVVGSSAPWFVGPAGDVNGDGYADLVLTNCNRYRSGCGGDAFVYLGGASGLGTTAAWSVLTTGNLAVSGPGDFDADGYADLAVSDWATISIYRGGPGGLSTTASVTLPKPASGATYWGYTVELADLNGDGLDDLVVGDPGQEKVSPFFAPSLSPGSAVVTLYASENHDFGSVLVNAGDVNGDGRLDVLVGAPNAAQPATWDRAQLFFGQAGGISSTVAGSQVFYGTTRDRQFGYALR